MRYTVYTHIHKHTHTHTHTYKLILSKHKYWQSDTYYTHTYIHKNNIIQNNKYRQTEWHMILNPTYWPKQNRHNKSPVISSNRSRVLGLAFCGERTVRNGIVSSRPRIWHTRKFSCNNQNVLSQQRKEHLQPQQKKTKKTIILQIRTMH